MPPEFEIEAEIERLLQSDLQGFQCPVCRHQEFEILDDLGSHLRTNLVHYEEGELIPKQRTRLISIACTNCGHIEQFAEHPLRRRAEVALGANS
jgi:predicted nucleic-acid-binding Zn-ribbon protein